MNIIKIKQQKISKDDLYSANCVQIQSIFTSWQFWQFKAKQVVCQNKSENIAFFFLKTF